MTGLLFGEHQLAVGEDVQHPAAAQAQLYLFNSGLLFQLAFQAPGLTANVSSKETALDVNFHNSPPFAIRCWIRSSSYVIVSEDAPILTRVRVERPRAWFARNARSLDWRSGWQKG